MQFMIFPQASCAQEKLHGSGALGLSFAAASEVRAQRGDRNLSPWAEPCPHTHRYIKIYIYSKTGCEALLKPYSHWNLFSLTLGLGGRLW